MRPMSLDSLRQDLRSAWRSLRHRPASTVAVVGMLALAIGITTAMFTIVDSLLIRRVPFPRADQIALLRMTSKTGDRNSTRPAAFDAWRKTGTFTAVEAAIPGTVTIATDTGEATRTIARVTPGIFSLLGGVTPVRGQLFGSTDGQPGADNRVLIAEDLWRS